MIVVMITDVVFNNDWPWSRTPARGINHDNDNNDQHYLNPDNDDDY